MLQTAIQGGTLIPSETSSTYSAPTDTDGTTYYYCVVTNTDPTATGAQTAEATSDPAEVTVHTDAEEPTISVQPADVTVENGGTADLSITASVTTGTLTYQWYSNATDSNTGGTLIPSETSSTYSAPTDTDGTTYYYCVVTNTDPTATGAQTAEATSDQAEVTVHTDAEEPTISVQPADVTVENGGTADLSITATVTTGTLTYQWYSNATDSNTGGDLIALATESTYSAPTDTEGTIYYYCVVTNTDDTATGDTTTEATSLTAEVTVQTNAEEPNITVQPADVTVDLGGTADLSITAEVTTGTLTYQWYSNATDSNTGGDLIALATESTYSAPTDTEGTMYYYCVVTNTDDTATGDTTTEATSLTAEVTVQTNAEEPNITVQPADVTVDLGGTADLSITAEVTTGTLTYQWYSNATDSNTGGDLIALATESTYSAPTDTEGTMYYYCVVTNTDDTATGDTTTEATSLTSRSHCADQRRRT